MRSVRKADNLTASVVMKSGNLNFLEPSGPLQACNGTAVPLHKNQTFTLVINLEMIKIQMCSTCFKAVRMPKI